MSEFASMPELDGTQPCKSDPELFFPTSTDDTEQINAAKALCSTCPFERPCLAFALTNSVHGIWGGRTESERAALQRAFGLPKRVHWSGAPGPTDFDDSEERP